MNTQLLTTTNNTCGTNKGLKSIAAVICMTAVFVFTNSSLFAQGFSNSEGKTTVTKTETQAASYNNYKGITDKNEAKKAWLQDHPEENIEGINASEAIRTAKIESDKKSEVAKKTAPVTSARQDVTPLSAETIDNAAVAPAASGKEANNVNTPAVKVNKSVEARNNRPSAVDQLPAVKPYDKSTVVNEVNKEVKYPQIPGFVATGNADADAKAFEVAKQNLQQNNPAEYNKYFSEKE